MLDTAGTPTAAGGMDHISSLIVRGTANDWHRAAERVQAHAVLRRTKEAAARVESLGSESDADDVDRLADIAQAEIRPSCSPFTYESGREDIAPPHPRDGSPCPHPTVALMPSS
ncbi:hypothetical protein [Streptomyces sp. NPDC127114]|uniref:hypothetical protein n=1 Tax=Streptomyces sp. NPDC127114 TaxID=3345366 RepID=UPI003628B088